jgi:membrane protein required for colicin V production
LVLMIFLVVRGVMRGFVAEVASLAGIVLGIWLGIRYMNCPTALLKPYVPEFSFLPIIGFAIIFLGVLVVCNLAGWGLRFVFKKVFLGWLDRTLGAALAVVKGVVISYLGIVILTVYLVPDTPLVARSRLAPAVMAVFQTMRGAVSDDHLRSLRNRLSGRSGEAERDGGNAAEGGPVRDGQR